MITKDAKQALAVVLSFLMAALPSFILQASETPGPDTGGATDAAPISSSELEALVSPIALYLDALVAQVLAAATFPDQVAIADYWLRQHKYLNGETLMQTVNGQSWDASVKALTQFPTVLNNMAKNLSWTSSLGEAYHDQPSEVMEAVQALRARAKAAGNLKSGPQITVIQQTPQTIVIQPANPQMVYVPEYNPAVIYGTPYVPPGYSVGDVAAVGILGFGAGIAVGAVMGGGCCGWGWGAWGCNWHDGAVVYNHNNFYGNAAWHSGYYSGYPNAAGYRSAYNASDDFSRNRISCFHGEGDRNLSNAWAHDDRGFGRSNAFSGLGGHFGGFGAAGGWLARAESGRGWGSMRFGGFGGGRFGGGGFGGGGFRGFRGGGFRR
jgi:hypothetical protein